MSDIYSIGKRMNIKSLVTRIVADDLMSEFKNLSENAQSDIGRFLICVNSLLAPAGTWNSTLRVPSRTRIYAHAFTEDLVTEMYNIEGLAMLENAEYLVSRSIKRTLNIENLKSIYLLTGDFMVDCKYVRQLTFSMIRSDFYGEYSDSDDEDSDMGFLVDAMLADEAAFFTKFYRGDSGVVDEHETLKRMRNRLRTRISLRDDYMISITMFNNPTVPWRLPCKYQEFVNSHWAGHITSEDLVYIQAVFVPLVRTRPVTSDRRRPVHKIPMELLTGLLAEMLFEN